MGYSWNVTARAFSKSPFVAKKFGGSLVKDLSGNRLRGLTWFHKWGYSQASIGWFISWNIPKKNIFNWMITRGTPIFRTPPYSRIWFIRQCPIKPACRFIPRIVSRWYPWISLRWTNLLRLTVHGIKPQVKTGIWDSRIIVINCGKSPGVWGLEKICWHMQGYPKLSWLLCLNHILSHAICCGPRNTAIDQPLLGQCVCSDVSCEWP